MVTIASFLAEAEGARSHTVPLPSWGDTAARLGWRLSFQGLLRALEREIQKIWDMKSLICNHQHCASLVVVSQADCWGTWIEKVVGFALQLDNFCHASCHLHWQNVSSSAEDSAGRKAIKGCLPSTSFFPATCKAAPRDTVLKEFGGSCQHLQLSRQDPFDYLL